MFISINGVSDSPEDLDRKSSAVELRTLALQVYQVFRAYNKLKKMGVELVMWIYSNHVFHALICLMLFYVY